MTGEHVNVTTTTGELREALGLVEHAVSKEDGRPILCCVLFEGDADGFRLVAADNYRVAVAGIEALGDVAEFGQAVVHRDYFASIKGLRGKGLPVVISRADRALTIEVKDGQRLVLPIMNGQYPAYKQVIDRTIKRTTIGINPVYLADVMRATAKLGVVAIHTGGPLQAVLIEGALGREFTEVVMPVRLVEGFRVEP